MKPGDKVLCKKRGYWAEATVVAMADAGVYAQAFRLAEIRFYKTGEYQEVTSGNK